jgi:hypothetical protein
MDNHLGVTVSRQMMASGLELRTKLRVVVNFSVENHPDRPVLVEHRLVASGKIDDAEAAHPESRSVLDEDSFVIRTAMHDRLAHAVNRGGFNALAGSRVYDACDPTHAYALLLD